MEKTGLREYGTDATCEHTFERNGARARAVLRGTDGMGWDGTGRDEIRQGGNETNMHFFNEWVPFRSVPPFKKRRNEVRSVLEKKEQTGR